MIIKMNDMNWKILPEKLDYDRVPVDLLRRIADGYPVYISEIQDGDTYWLQFHIQMTALTDQTRRFAQVMEHPAMIVGDAGVWIQSKLSGIDYFNLFWGENSVEPSRPAFGPTFPTYLLRLKNTQ